MKSAEIRQGISPELDGRRYERDIANQQEFISFIEGVRPDRIAVLPDLSEFLDHEGKRTNNLQEHFLKDYDRAYLSQSFMDRVQSNRFPDRVDFLPHPTLRLGRENSQQQVFFGSLVGRWFHEAEDKPIQVAVKPIASGSIAEDKALHELALYQHMEQEGLPTLNVLGAGIFREPRNDIVGFIISEFEPDMITLDTLNWNKMEVTEVIYNIERVIETLALLHSRLLFHGDSEFKNVGIGEAGESLRIVDMEWGTSVAAGDGNIDMVSRQLSADFSCVARSFDEFIFRDDTEVGGVRNDVDRFNLLHNLFYEPYFERLMHMNSPYIDVLAKAYEDVLKQKERQAKGEW